MINEKNYKELMVSGLAIAYGIIKNYHDSEDIVSKAIIKLLNQDSKKIDDPASYFRQIVRNEAKSFYNEQKKKNSAIKKHRIEKELELTELDCDEITKGIRWQTIYSYLNEKEKKLYQDWKRYGSTEKIAKRNKKSVKTISSQISRLKQTLAAIRYKTNSENGGTVKQLTYLEFKRLKSFISSVASFPEKDFQPSHQSKSYFEKIDIRKIPRFDNITDYEIKRNGAIFTIVFGCTKGKEIVVWLANFIFYRFNRLKVLNIDTNLEFAEISCDELPPPNPDTLLIPLKYDQIT